MSNCDLSVKAAQKFLIIVQLAKGLSTAGWSVQRGDRGQNGADGQSIHRGISASTPWALHHPVDQLLPNSLSILRALEKQNTFFN